MNMPREKINLSHEIKKFIKFSIVGGSGILVNMGLLYLFTEYFGMFYLLSSVCAILLAMINNFIWNDCWTWRDQRKPGLKAFVIRLIKFCAVASIAGYGGNLGVLYLLTHFFHVHYLLSNLIGIAIGTMLNYFLNNVWTFRVK